MKRSALSVFLLSFLSTISSAADTQWLLQQSTISYHISHPLHQVVGMSDAARGKGICHAGNCEFLVAAPVKSFDSGDSNRDLHMLQATRGAQFPLISVRTSVSESALESTTIDADLQMQFAGQTAEYRKIPFQLTHQGKDVRLTGTIPATLSDFKIEPPSLLGIAVKNKMPIHIDMDWRPQ